MQGEGPMKNILSVGKDLVDEIRLNFKPELLKDIFYLRTAEWKYHQMSVEGGTIDIFGDLHGFVYNSFDLIPAAVDIVLSQEDSKALTTSLSLLYRCIEESNTTEMPVKLSKQWNVLKSKVNRIGNTDSRLFWESICEWYRIDKKE